MGLFDRLRGMLGGGGTPPQPERRPPVSASASGHSLGDGPGGRPATGSPDRLRALGLPVLTSIPELARAMERSEREIHWLADAHRMTARRAPHYRCLPRPKRDGRIRIVLAPRMHLKAAQRWILRFILDKVEPGPHAHGFRRGRSIRTHAAAHVGRDIVVQCDLEAFFHQFTLRHATGCFRGFGYSREIARTLALICTAPVREMAGRLAAGAKLSRATLLEGARQYRGNRQSNHPLLPQGAPTSPALANLLCRRLDGRLAGLARKFGATYTRYADDCAFSGGPEFRAGLRRFIPLLKTIIRDHGHRPAPAKWRFARKGGRQRVTGLVVNRTVNVPRDEVRRLRAILHNCLRHGPAGQNRDNHPDFRAHLLGRVAHVAFANPARGAKLREAFARIAWER